MILSQPVVSVVVPCYKQARFLPEAIASVVAQTYTQWECVIVNDGSPDNTAQVAAALLQQHAGHDIRIINQSNGGLPAARNAGIRSSRGRYILPLDSDDRLAPTYLQQTVAVLDGQPAIAVAYTDMQTFGLRSERVTVGQFQLEAERECNQLPYCSLYRRALWDAVGGYNTNLDSYEDWDFWIGAMKRGFRGQRVPEALFHYRTSATSMVVEAEARRPKLMGRIALNHEGLYPALHTEAGRGFLGYVPPRRRVLLVTETLGSPASPEQRLVEDLGNKLLAQHYEVEIATRWVSSRSSAAHQGMRVHQLAPDAKSRLDVPSVDLGEARRLVAAGNFRAVLLIGDPLGWVPWLADGLRLPATRTIFIPMMASQSPVAWRGNPDITANLKRLFSAADRLVSRHASGLDAQLFQDLGLPAVCLEDGPQGVHADQYQALWETSWPRPTPEGHAEPGPAGRPLVSVIVPTRNRPDTLKVALRSILAQTFQDFEILVVNDGGSGVEEVIRDLDVGTKIHYISAGRNRGLAGARNLGLRMARGRYIAYLDDDDRFYPHHLETLVAALEEGTHQVVYVDAHRVHQKVEQGGVVDVGKDRPYSLDFDRDHMLIMNFIPVLCVMHERRCTDESGGFDESLGVLEDWDLWIRLSRTFKFRHIAQVTCEFTWRMDGTSMTSERNALFRLTGEMIYAKHKDQILENPRARQMLYKARFARVDSLLAGGRQDDAIRMLEEIVAQDPEYAEGHNDLAVFYHASHRLMDAQRSILRAAALPGAGPEVADNLALIQAAVQAAHPLVPPPPGRPVPASDASDYRHCGARAESLAAEGQVDAAIAAVATFVEKHATCAEAWNDLAVLHHMAGRLDAAAQASALAVQWDGKSALHRRTRAIILLQQGSAREAFQVLEPVLTADAQDEEAGKLAEEIAAAMAPPCLPSSSPMLTRIRQAGLLAPGQPLRLHLGCGDTHLAGYINIDHPPDQHNVMQTKADLHADVMQLDLPDGSVDEIRLHHLFEHFSRVKALALLLRWQRWLKVGGRLHIETPDILGSAKSLLSDAPLKTKMGVIRHLAGDQAAPWAYHVDHWFPERFQHTLTALGFGEVETRSSSWPHEPFLSNVEAFAVKVRQPPLSEQLAAADSLLSESTVSPGETATLAVWHSQLRDFLAPPTTPATDFATLQQAIPMLAPQPNATPLRDIHNFNQHDRDEWVKAKVATIPAGSRVLDIGAGTCPYRSLFAHCDYRTHDFKKYDGVKLGGTNHYGAIDYISEIGHIPVPDASFDVILCTEVLEHVPEPIAALEEMARILRPGGRLLITAPLGSGLHQLPYHFYGGYTPEWYRHFGKKFGFHMREITPNGGFFKLLAQECARISWTWPQHAHLHGADGPQVQQLFGEWLPRYLFGMEEKVFIDQFTVGYHVEAVKSDQAPLSTSDHPSQPSSHPRQNGAILATPARSVLALVFSKDRALQLDGTLRSFAMQCLDRNEVDIKVLYRASTAEQHELYQTVAAENRFAELIAEKDFRAQTLGLIARYRHVLFLVDDNIFVREFRLGDIAGALDRDPQVLGCSLRLGQNTTYCYPLRAAQRVPATTPLSAGLSRFAWVGAEHDFGYPLEVSSSVYRAEDLLRVLAAAPFTNPNLLETQLAGQAAQFARDRPALLCFDRSVTFCNPVNVVQTAFAANRAGQIAAYAPEALSRRFADGERMRASAYVGYLPRGCHEEVPLEFERRDGASLAR